MGVLQNIVIVTVISKKRIKENKMLTKDIYITNHAIEKYKLRFSANGKNIEGKILSIISRGCEVSPVNPALLISGKGSGVSRFFHRTGKVAVLKDDRVITVYPFDRSKFKNGQKMQNM